LEYIIVRWHKLIAYAYTGDIEIDNNLVENAIRPLALGRKNYLFAGSDDAAMNIAKFYSLFSSCKALNINPYDYLKWVIDEFPKSTINHVQSFTPLAYLQLKMV
ncbi:MAG: transposase, partial [Saprospiraceae bacterium]|nr:transposase [Saprospiraceae bacterium]